METAEQFAHKVISIEYKYAQKDYVDHISLIEAEYVKLFQSALNAPMELTDDKPEKIGYYWYEKPDSKAILHVEVFPDGNKIFIDGHFWINLSSATGRFSHMIKPPEGRE